jgi:YD repeat-containing protein
LPARALALLLVLLAAPAARAQSSGDDTPWWDQAARRVREQADRGIIAGFTDSPDGRLPTETWAERFDSADHQFFYALRILGAEAGRAAMSIGTPYVHETWGEVLPVEGLAVSVGFFAAVYPFENTALTLVRPTTGLPVWTRKVIDERDANRVYEVAYDQAGFRSEVIRERDGRSTTYSRRGASDMHDALSWIVDLRTRDFSVGQTYVYFIYDGWKVSRLTCRVAQHRRLFTAIGMRDVAEFRFTREVLASYAALPWAATATQLPPAYLLTDGPTDVGVGWFSVDDDRIPIGVSITGPIGSMEIRLTGAEIP